MQLPNSAATTDSSLASLLFPGANPPNCGSPTGISAPEKAAAFADLFTRLTDSSPKGTPGGCPLVTEAVLAGAASTLVMTLPSEIHVISEDAMSLVDGAEQAEREGVADSDSELGKPEIFARAEGDKHAPRTS